MNNKRNHYCTKHPDRIGFMDLGEAAINRYPCRECYLKMVAERKENGVSPRRDSV